MYKIIEPNTLKALDIRSNEGKRLLKNFLNSIFIQTGGEWQSNKKKNENQEHDNNQQSGGGWGGPQINSDELLLNPQSGGGWDEEDHK